MLGAAHALLHLIDFDEPFGYSVVEAMACGTPVIAHRRGSMPELITDGVTGFLVDGVDEAVRAVDAAGALDRAAIRAAAVDRFGRAAMVERYVDVYRSVLATRQRSDIAVAGFMSGTADITEAAVGTRVRRVSTSASGSASTGSSRSSARHHVRGWRHLVPAGLVGALVAGVVIYEHRVLARLDATPDPDRGDGFAFPAERTHAIATPDGGSLHAEECGSGRPVVLLHGHGANLGIFAPLASRLVAGGRRVVAVDQRGFGRSSAVPAAFGFDGLVDDLATVLGRARSPRRHRGGPLDGWRGGARSRCRTS